MSAALAFDDVVTLTGGRFGKFDVPCPFCSPNRNVKRRVLRIWRYLPTWPSSTTTGVSKGLLSMMAATQSSQFGCKSGSQPAPKSRDALATRL